VGPNFANAPDAELIGAGSADAFAVVYDRHVAAIYTWARSRVGEHAADLTAETFARAWLSRGSFRDGAEGSAFPWLLGIAQNVLRESLRRQRIEERARARLGLARELAADAGYELVEERLSLPEAALRAVAGLPEADRQVLNLRVVEGRPYREIAAQLSCTSSATAATFTPRSSAISRAAPEPAASGAGRWR
jgi:RNA polymerase sigma factor (sigma-70 family)